MEPFMDKDVKKQVEEAFHELVNPITVMLFTSKVQACEHCAEARQIVEEVAALSEKITVQEVDFEQNPDLAKKYNIQRIPTYAILQGTGEKLVDFGIRFSGAPVGVEFTVLIHGLVLVSGGDSELKEGTRDFLHNLKQPLNLKVFTTPT